MGSASVQKKPQATERKHGNPEEADPASVQVLAPSSGEHVDKIRDILFGSNMRDYERRFGQIEARISKEISDLKEEIRKRFDALEASNKREVEALNARLNAERDARTEVRDKLSQDVSELSRTLEKRARQIEDQGVRMERSIQEQLAAQSKATGEEMVRKHDELTQLVERQSGELRHQKLDRAAAASFLAEIAMRLNNEPGMAALESLAHGRSTD